MADLESPDTGERLNKIERDMAILSQQLGSVVTAVGGLTAGFETFKQSRAISWPAIVGGIGALSVIVTAVWYILNQNVQLAMAPMMTATQISLGDRTELRGDLRVVGDRIGAMETNLEGFMKASLAKEIELETQFKNVGQQVNTWRAEQMRINCRMDAKECTTVVYWPELGRVVTNGRKD